MTSSSEAEAAYVLGYNFDQSPLDGYSSRFELRFAAFKLMDISPVGSRREYSWTTPTGPERDVEPHVLSRGETSLPFRARNVLERNIADLVTMHITQLAGERATVIVMGPPLRKVVERLAYRCLSSGLTIAFLTWPEVAGATFFGSPDEAGWTGPYPSFHEDSYLRTYHYTRGLQESGTPVRMDLFCQTLGDTARAQDRSVHLEGRMLSVSKVIAANPFVKADGARVQIPDCLGVLRRSLQWSDDKLRSELGRYEGRLHKTDKDRVSAINSHGVLALATAGGGGPIKARENRLAIDGGYVRELLFADLEQEIEDFGRQGVLRFVRSPRSFY